MSPAAGWWTIVWHLCCICWLASTLTESQGCQNPRAKQYSSAKEHLRLDKGHPKKNNDERPKLERSSAIALHVPYKVHNLNEIHLFAIPDAKQLSYMLYYMQGFTKVLHCSRKPANQLEITYSLTTILHYSETLKRRQISFNRFAIQCSAILYCVLIRLAVHNIK